MAYRNKKTGEIITDQEAQQKGIAKPMQFQPSAPAQKTDVPEMSFMNRLKMSFGGKEERAKQQEIEKASGKKGFQWSDIPGDIADVAGGALPFIGGVAGGAIGTPIVGGAAGAAIGKGAQNIIGNLLGVRKSEKPLDETLSPIKEGAATLAGGVLLSKVAAPLAKSGWSIITGQSGKIAEQVFKNPAIADKVLKEGGDDVLRSVVNEGATKSIQIKNAFVKKFTENIDKLFKNSKSATAIPKDLMDGLDNLLPKGTKMTENGLDFSITPLAASPGEATNINKLYHAIDNWQDYTPKGLVEFKQLVGKFARFPLEGGGTSKSPVIGRYYKYVDDLIKSRLNDSQKKAYSLLDKTFSDKIEFYDEIVDAFNSGDPFKRLAGLFGKSNDTLRQLVKFYEQQSGKKVFPVVAARELSQEAPKSWLNIRSYVDSVLTPELQTKLTALMGKAYQNVPKVGKEAIRQSTIRTTTKPLSEIFGGSLYNLLNKK